MNSGSDGSSAAGMKEPFLCKLFGDMVPSHLCDLRRQELIAQGDFSCDGCSMLVDERS